MSSYNNNEKKKIVWALLDNRTGSRNQVLGILSKLGFKYKIIEIPVNLTEFSVNSVTQGIDSLGEVTIRISDNLGQIFSGRGSDADIVVSSAKAYVNAINRMITIREESSNSTIEK